MENYTKTHLDDIQNALIKLLKVMRKEIVIEVDACSKELLDSMVMVMGYNKENNSYYWYNQPISYQTCKMIASHYGISNTEWINTFHKSLEKVANSSLEELMSEQLLHYFSTYGLESVGFTAIPYIPAEAICTEPFKGNQKTLTVVTVLDDETIKEVVVKYLRGIQAPNAADLEDIKVLLNYAIDKKWIDDEDLKSFELKVIYYKETENVPQDPEEWLRYVIYRLTGSTLLIKSKEVIANVKKAAQKSFDLIWLKYVLHIRLAQVFFRYKPLFLALKTKETAPIINKIRRLADKYHKPCSDVCFKNISLLASQNRWEEVKTILNRASLRELIKIQNFVNSAMQDDVTAQNFNIRNGKIWVQEVKKTRSNTEYFRLMTKIMTVCSLKIAHKLDDKTFYIPSYVDYAVPYSEKQFVDNMPWGTSVKVDNNFTGCSVGIAWNNCEDLDRYEQRVDLDLHLTTPTQNFGWNGNYRDADVLFSGDMTDATNGAAEVFYIKENTEPMILSINRYTSNMGKEIEYKFVVTNKEFSASSDRKTCPIDMNDAIFTPINLKVGDRGSTLGVINKNKFYFYGGTLGENLTPDRELNKKLLESQLAKITHQFTMAELLENAGATVIHTEQQKQELMDVGKEVIDLSPNVLDRSTLMNLVDELDK